MQETFIFQKEFLRVLVNKNDSPIVQALRFEYMNHRDSENDTYLGVLDDMVCYFSDDF